MMPGVDGHEVCRRVKSQPRTRDIPVMFLTLLSDSADETHGLELGAVDYITKPVSAPILPARVATHLGVEAMQDLLRDQKHHLELEVRRRTAKVLATLDATIHALASLADVYDALISRRVYKAGMPHEQAAAIILAGAGTHFDPDVVDAFRSQRESFQWVARTYADSEVELRHKMDQLRELR